MFMKILLLLLILQAEINTDFVDDNYEDLMKCVYTDIDKCSSTRLKTNNLECCQFKLENLDSSHNDEDDDDVDICSAVFTSYVSQSMIKQIESIAIEE